MKCQKITIVNFRVENSMNLKGPNSSWTSVKDAVGGKPMLKVNFMLINGLSVYTTCGKMLDAILNI